MSNRLLKTALLNDIRAINDPHILLRMQEYISLIKEFTLEKSMKNFLSHVGSITKEEAEEMHKIIDEEFSKIEGEW